MRVYKVRMVKTHFDFPEKSHAVIVFRCTSFEIAEASRKYYENTESKIAEIASLRMVKYDYEILVCEDERKSEIRDRRT